MDFLRVSSFLAAPFAVLGAASRLSLLQVDPEPPQHHQEPSTVTSVSLCHQDGRTGVSA